jgi:trimeric autotransporter adhesin
MRMSCSCIHNRNRNERLSGLTVNGTFVSASDRNPKEDIAAVDQRAVLEKVTVLPIARWNYKHDKEAPHLGPIPQDFRQAFGLDEDDKHIATVDADGVALAAIQGLNQKLEAEVKSKDARITELEKRLAAIEALLKK